MEVLGQLLTRTDVSKRLSVPSKCLKNFPHSKGSSNTVDLKVKNGSGCTWTFRCSIRKRVRYLKPVLLGDWRRFAATKELSIGDQVKLFKEEEEDPLALASGSVQYYYRVKVKKAVKLVGKVFGHAHANAPRLPLQSALIFA